MRFSAMLLVIFTLLLSTIANPVPSIAAENVNTTDVSIASDNTLPVYLSIEWCWEPGMNNGECTFISQPDSHCVYQYGYFNRLRAVRMPDGVFW